jgi:hypothetical protein
MKRKQTNTNTLILAALGGLVVYCLYKKKQKAASLGSLNRYGMEGKKNMQEVFDVIEAGRPGTFNDELTYDGESITASDNLKENAGVPYEITTKRDLRKAISYLRKQDKAILYRADIADDIAYMSTAKRKQRAKDLLNYNGTGDANNSDDGYLQTLFYIVDGGKFAWNSEGNSRGVKDELLATRSGDGRQDRKMKAGILNDSRGVTPERFAENITAYGADDTDVKEGVLQAISEVNTPAQALDILEGIAQKAYEQDFPF